MQLIQGYFRGCTAALNATALRGLKFSPIRPAKFRAIDQHAFVGKLDVCGYKSTMTQWRYAEGKLYQPTDAYVKTRRPAKAMK